MGLLGSFYISTWCKFLMHFREALLQRVSNHLVSVKKIFFGMCIERRLKPQPSQKIFCCELQSVLNFAPADNKVYLTPLHKDLKVQCSQKPFFSIKQALKPNAISFFETGSDSQQLSIQAVLYMTLSQVLGFQEHLSLFVVLFPFSHHDLCAIQKVLSSKFHHHHFILVIWNPFKSSNFDHINNHHQKPYLTIEAER